MCGLLTGPCGYDVVVAYNLAMVDVRVRFPLPAPMDVPNRKVGKVGPGVSVICVMLVLITPFATSILLGDLDDRLPSRS